MKKYLFVFAFLFLSLAAFSQGLKIPKNTEILDKTQSLRYVDDDLIFLYELSYSPYLNDDYLFNITKKKMSDNIETSITFYFDNEQEIDDFNNYFFDEKFKLEYIPDIFNYFKNFAIESGMTLLQVEGDDGSISKILIYGYITKNPD